MLAMVVGKRAVDYTSKKSGQNVKGTELFYVCDAPQENGMTGQRAASIFTRVDCSVVQPGKKYNMAFDLANNDKAVLISVLPA
jgi:hypothetical protein